MLPPGVSVRKLKARVCRACPRISSLEKKPEMGKMPVMAMVATRNVIRVEGMTRTYAIGDMRVHALRGIELADLGIAEREQAEDTVLADFGGVRRSVGLQGIERRQRFFRLAVVDVVGRDARRFRFAPFARVNG